MLLRYGKLPAQANIVNGVALTLIDVDRYVDIAFVGRNRHLCRENLETYEASILIKRPQRLEIAGQLRSRIFIRAAEKTERPRHTGLQQIEQVVVGKLIVTDDLDVPDAGVFALENFYVDAYSIALEFFQRSLESHRIVALTEIQTL